MRMEITRSTFSFNNSTINKNLLVVRALRLMFSIRDGNFRIGS